MFQHIFHLSRWISTRRTSTPLMPLGQCTGPRKSTCEKSHLWALRHCINSRVCSVYCTHSNPAARWDDTETKLSQSQWWLWGEADFFSQVSLVRTSIIQYSCYVEMRRKYFLAKIHFHVCGNVKKISLKNIFFSNYNVVDAPIPIHPDLT